MCFIALISDWPGKQPVTLFNFRVWGGKLVHSIIASIKNSSRVFFSRKSNYGVRAVCLVSDVVLRSNLEQTTAIGRIGKGRRSTWAERWIGWISLTNLCKIWHSSVFSAFIHWSDQQSKTDHLAAAPKKFLNSANFVFLWAANVHNFPIDDKSRQLARSLSLMSIEKFHRHLEFTNCKLRLFHDVVGLGLTSLVALLISVLLLHSNNNRPRWKSDLQSHLPSQHFFLLPSFFCFSVFLHNFNSFPKLACFCHCCSRTHTGRHH